MRVAAEEEEVGAQEKRMLRGIPSPEELWSVDAADRWDRSRTESLDRRHTTSARLVHYLSNIFSLVLAEFLLSYLKK